MKNTKIKLTYLRLLFSLFVLALIFGVSACGGDDDNNKSSDVIDITGYYKSDKVQADGYYILGNAHRVQGEYREAIKDYDQSIKLQKSNANVYRDRGIAYYFLKENERSIENYNKAIELNSSDANTYFYLGDLYRSLGEYDDAISYYTQAIELKPDHIAAYRNRGAAYYFLKQYERSVESYTQAITLKEDDVNVYLYRGDAYQRLEKHDKAISDYTKAITLDQSDDIAKTQEPEPADINAHVDLGAAFRGLEKYEDAVSSYTDAINVSSSYTAAYKGRGIAYYLQGKYEEAVSDYTEALKKNSSDVYFYRGDSYNKLGQADNAAADYIAAIDRLKNRGEVIDSADVYGELERHYNSNDYSIPTITLPLKRSWYLYERSKAYLGSGNLESALSSIEVALFISYEARNVDLRGDVYLALENTMLMCQDYANACEIRKDTSCTKTITYCP